MTRFVQRVRHSPWIAAAVCGAGWGASRLRAWRRRARSNALLAERRRIAREIHDSLAQILLGSSLEIEQALGSLGTSRDTTRRHLGRAQELIRDSLAAARRSVWDLRDPALAGNDLPRALASSVEALAGAGGNRLELRVAGRPRPLPPAMTEHLLRIGQEAMTNAVRHARAAHILVDLVFAPTGVTLRVRDDGSGLPPAPANGSRHLGLLHMAERAEQMAARLAIRSAPGQGTEVEVEASV
jgi:signal transduction histidine kinase